MGLLSGSVSATKFYVRGEIKKGFKEAVVKAVRLRAFQELTVEDDKEEQIGWSVIGKPLDLELTHENLFANSFVTLGLRADKWRIPRPLFKAHFEEAAAAHSAKTGRPRLSKREKDDIKLRVTKKLRKRLVPVMRAYDLCWDLNRQELRFGNRSARVNEDLRALFEQTFGGLDLHIDEESPFMAAQSLLSEKQLEVLTQVEQASFETR